MRKDFKFVDEPFARFESVFEPEREDRACAFGRVLLRHRMIRVARERCVLDPAHLRVLFEMLRYFKRIFKMPVHAHAKSLHTLKKKERVERTYARANVSQSFDARFDDERNLAEGIPEPHSVVSRSGFGEVLELPVVPREVAAIDDDSTDGCSVSAHEFRQGVNHHVSAVLDRPGHVRRGESIIDY